MSDSLYNPDQAAVLVQPWSEAFRGQRDVGLRVPINFNVVPAVSLQAACFAHNQYAGGAFGKCFSNLLAVGFKRFYVDVYWDPGRTVWSLCPAEIPPSAQDQQQESTQAIVTVQTDAPSVISSSSFSESTEAVETFSSLPGPVPLLARQDGSSVDSAGSQSQTQTPSPTVPSEASGASASVPPSPLSMPEGYNESLFEVGNYNCSDQMTLSYVADILDNYFEQTDTTVDASLIYLMLNIHVASSYTDPDAPASKPSGTGLPPSGFLLKDVVRGNLSDETFTPDKLHDQRDNLDTSWFDVARDQKPAAGYYTTRENSIGQPQTQEGWPTEAYAEFQKYLRVLVGLHTVDPQMSEYDYTDDLSTIFRRGQLHAAHDVNVTSNGRVSSGCLFDSSQSNITDQTNSSWAMASAPSLSLPIDLDPHDPIPAITNLTSCGLTPILNSTLSDTTADQNFAPYLAFAASTLWSWAPGQPLNTSSSRKEFENKCTAISLTAPYPNRWVTVDCTKHHHFACQSNSEPYNWVISSERANYFSGDEACPSSYTFTVPHTPLEQAHLLASVPQSSTSPIESIYINFNSIDVPDCWTVGINATCPYQPRQDVNQTRLVVVPTVAAVIIFVLAAATFFVKCAANRRDDLRGRRRRNVGGWVYEGVPS